MGKLKVPKIEPMARLNTRIEISQQRYIKALAKSSNRTEGEILRAMLAECIKVRKTKNK